MRAIFKDDSHNSMNTLHSENQMPMFKMLYLIPLTTAVFPPIVVFSKPF
jgi:hypothetical protein